MRCVQKVFWKIRETDRKYKEAKEPLIAEETEYKEDKKAVLKGKMEPLQVHTFNTLSPTSWTVNSSEYNNRIEVEYNPSERLKNYFNSLSQDQCTKLINQLGKMLEEL